MTHRGLDIMFEIANRSAVISSVDLVKMINSFRKEEYDLKAKRQADNGEVITVKYTELEHGNFLKSVDKEIETMDLLGLEPHVNFYGGSYADKQGQQRRCFHMTRDGALQMLNKESTYVRVKTVEYVDTLENRLSSLEQQKATLLLQIYNGGQQGVLASQQLTEIEVAEATAPLLDTIAEQDATITDLTSTVEEQQPCVDYVDAVLAQQDSILVRHVCKLAFDKSGINIGEKKLYAVLRSWGLINKSKKYGNEPTQNALNSGYLEVETSMINTPYGQKEIWTIKVTPKGQVHIIQKLAKMTQDEVDSIWKNSIK